MQFSLALELVVHLLPPCWDYRCVCYHAQTDCVKGSWWLACITLRSKAMWNTLAESWVTPLTEAAGGWQGSGVYRLECINSFILWTRESSLNMFFFPVSLVNCQNLNKIKIDKTLHTICVGLLNTLIQTGLLVTRSFFSKTNREIGSVCQKGMDMEAVLPDDQAGKSNRKAPEECDG